MDVDCVWNRISVSSGSYNALAQIVAAVVMCKSNNPVLTLKNSLRPPTPYLLNLLFNPL